MSTPSDYPGHGEQRRVDLHRNANQVIDEARIKINIGAKRLVFAFRLINRLDGNLLDPLIEFIFLGTSFLLGKGTSHFLQKDRSRV